MVPFKLQMGITVIAVARHEIGLFRIHESIRLNLLFARPPVLSDARVRENGLGVSPSMGRAYRGGVAGCQ